MSRDDDDPDLGKEPDEGEYEIDFACGHTDTLVIPEKYVKYASRYNCPRCRKTAAQDAAAQAGVLKLRGSDKQVAWAADIREGILVKLTNMENRLIESLPSERDLERAAVMRANIAACQSIRKQTSAPWWIDHRGLDVEKLVAGERG